MAEVPPSHTGVQSNRSSQAPMPPRSPLPSHSPHDPGNPRSPVCKTKSVGLERNRPKIVMERFLSVEQTEATSRGRRRSGSGLQNLSGSASPPPILDGHKHKTKGILNNLLQPINTYVRRRSMSRESSSSNLDSDDSRSRSRSGGSCQALNSSNAERRGSHNTFFSKIANNGAKLAGNGRRNSEASASIRKKKFHSRESSISIRKNSLDVTKDRKAADILKDLKHRKPEASQHGAEKSPRPIRKDSIDITKNRKLDIRRDRKYTRQEKPIKEKVSKKKSLGETLSLRLPGSIIRRNSIDAFSLKNLFSLSRKNSAEDIKSGDSVKKNNQIDKLLKVNAIDLKRRHSHGGGDVRPQSAYIYKPMKRDRVRLGSFGRQGASDKAGVTPPVLPQSGSSNIYDEFSHHLDRRSSGPSVVVSPPSGSSISRRSNSATTSDSSASDSDHHYDDSMSHSSITSLDTEDDSASPATNDSESEENRSNTESKHIQQRRKKVAKSNRHPSTSSRQSSTTEEDVFESSSSDSEESSKKSEPESEFWKSLQAGPPPVDIAASSEDDAYNLYDEFIFEGMGIM